jgi:hypothetical protein
VYRGASRPPDPVRGISLQEDPNMPKLASLAVAVLVSSMAFAQDAPAPEKKPVVFKSILALLAQIPKSEMQNVQLMTKWCAEHAISNFIYAEGEVVSIGSGPMVALNEQYFKFGGRPYSAFVEATFKKEWADRVNQLTVRKQKPGGGAPRVAPGSNVRIYGKIFSIIVDELSDKKSPQAFIRITLSESELAP